MSLQLYSTGEMDPNNDSTCQGFYMSGTGVIPMSGLTFVRRGRVNFIQKAQHRASLLIEVVDLVLDFLK